jgi:hypothetical protein
VILTGHGRSTSRRSDPAQGERRDPGRQGRVLVRPGRPQAHGDPGADGIHGYKEEPKVAFIEGKITDRLTLDVKALASGKDVTVTLDLANGKMIVLRNAWYAGDGTATTGEAEVMVRWEGQSAQEIS